MNTREIAVFKQVLKDFDKIKCEIDTLINSGYTLEQLKEKIFDIQNVVCITNYKEDTYLDFQYETETYGNYLTIYNDKNNGLHLTETAEIWVGCDFLGSFYLEELEKIISSFYLEKLKKIIN